MTAHKEGMITKTFKEINKEFLSTDIVFICSPVSHSVRVLKEYAGQFGENTIITDVGSTKGEISNVAKILGLINFIGGHPMAGSEKTGYRNSIPHLFENAFYILTVCEETNKELLKKMVDFVSSLGAIPIILDADEHDLVTAAISHVPHIMASSLVNMVARLNEKNNNFERLAAGGFKDLTRIASSSPSMWESICIQNKKNIDLILEMYINELNDFRKKVKEDSSKEIFKYFEDSKETRDNIKDRNKGKYFAYYEISIDIEDKPGSIAKVANVLAENEINVKNINIPANREFENGCLIVSFEDESFRIHALSALKKSGIKAYKR